MLYFATISSSAYTVHPVSVKRTFLSEDDPTICKLTVLHQLTTEHTHAIEQNCPWHFFTHRINRNSYITIPLEHDGIGGWQIDTRSIKYPHR